MLSGKKKIYKALNIEDGEATPVFLMIIQTIFIGVFYGTFDLTAHTLFLKHFPEDMISKGYVVSGILGIFMTATFSKVQSKIKFATLSKFTFLFISACTLMLWVLFQISVQNWVVFLAFILLGPLNIVAGLTFWGTAGRIFNLRQGKRLFGIIDSGQIFGIILSSYAIPFILQFMNGTHNLFLISGLSICGSLLVEIVLTGKYKIDADSVTDSQAKEQVESEHSQVGFIGIAKTPYLRYMALFVAFSMFTAFFVQFSFLCVTNEKYPEEASLASFLGFFTGTMTIVTFLVKTFVYGKLMKSYGLKICLLLSSLLLLLFTAIAILAGTFGGYTVAAGSGFIYFFMLISLSRLFNQTLKGALEGPAFKLLYQSISKKIRFDVQAKVDGTVNEFSALFSGILLSALGALSFIKLIHYSVATFVILGTWAFITFRLYREYRNSLDQALDQSDSQKTQVKVLSSEKIVPSQVALARKTMPLQYHKFLDDFVNHTAPSDMPKDDLGLMSDVSGLFVTDKLPVGWNDWYIKNMSSAQKSDYSAKELSDLILNRGVDGVSDVFRHLNQVDAGKRLLVLMTLLRSHYLNVQQVAISLIGCFGNTELLGTLAEFVDDEKLGADAIIAMRNIVVSMSVNRAERGRIGQQLMQLYYKTNVTLLFQQTLLELMMVVHTESSVQFLTGNFSYHKSEILNQTVSLLRNLPYQASASERQRFFHPITEAAQVISWDYAAIESLKATDVDSPLLTALESEQKHHMDYLLNLLSITYKAQSVSNIKDNLDMGGEGTSYALELFDMLLSEEIKPIVVSVFDELPVAEKIEILQSHFPVELVSGKQLILNLLNRDPNYISKYTKQLALQEYPKFVDVVTDTLLAQMFSPIPDMQQLAASVVAKMNRKAYADALIRIDLRSRRMIESFVSDNEQYECDVLSAAEMFKQRLGVQSFGNTDLMDFIEFGYVGNAKWQEFVGRFFVLLLADVLKPGADTTLIVDGVARDNVSEEKHGKMYIGITNARIRLMGINKSDIVNRLIDRLL